MIAAQSCPTLCDPMDYATRLLCPWNSPVKNTGSGLSFPSPEDFPSPGTEPKSPVSSLQADSLPAKSSDAVVNTE